jgi:hypothetical protein
MTQVAIESISVFGQGLAGWEKSLPIFQDFSKYDESIIPPIESRFLTFNNKRRTSPHMHAAIQAAEHAILNTGIDETQVNLIFASSECDLDITQDNLLALTHKEKQLSPQKFQNVILNAAAGHLGIFIKNVSGSTSVSGVNNVFSVGLLQAYTSLLCDTEHALLVAYDAPSIMPYGPGNRPFFSVGMLLSKNKRQNSLATMSLKLGAPTKNNFITHKALADLQKTTPAAGCLPLLIAVARNSIDPVELYYSSNLIVEATLCF